MHRSAAELHSPRLPDQSRHIAARRCQQLRSPDSRRHEAPRKAQRECCCYVCIYGTQHEKLSFFRRRPRRNTVVGLVPKCGRSSSKLCEFPCAAVYEAHHYRSFMVYIRATSPHHIRCSKPFVVLSLTQMLTTELEVAWPAIPYLFPDCKYRGRGAKYIGGSPEQALGAATSRPF